MRAFLFFLSLVLLVAAAEVDIRGHCLATDSSYRCRESEMPAELAEWIFREEDEEGAEKYMRNNPGNRKCYEDSDVVRINGVSGAKLSSLEVRRRVFH